MAIRPGVGSGTGADPDAERRRKALKNALFEAGMTAAQAAQKAGLPTPNALYNFLGNRTRSLSIETLEQLARVIPGSTVASLRGDEDPGLSHTVPVRAEARAGAMRVSFDLPARDQIQAPLPIDPTMRAAGAYGVAVREPGAEKMYPEGTILVVMPVGAYEGTLATGRRVILQRIRANQVEVTVRELDVQDGKAWLWPRSTDPLHQTPVEMPWPFQGDRMWRKGEERFSIAGIVVGAYVPEN